MTIFKNNFNNPFSQIKNDQKCYWVIYKSIPHTITCNGKSVSVELPVAPEKINHNISYEWWAANQNRIQQIVPCDSVALDIDSSGKIPFCVISSSQDPNLNSTRDCALLYPEEQQLIQFLQNNSCDMSDSTNPVVIWYNDILSNNSKISSSPQQFFNSFAEACNNCDIFCTTCVPFSESVGVSSLLRSNGSIVSGNNISIKNNNIDLNDYFDTNLRPIVAYSKDSINGKFASSNSQLSSFNFTVPSKLGFDKALFINDQGQVSSQDVVPGQIIPLSDTVILGSTTTTRGLSSNSQLPPSPPTILSFRIINNIEMTNPSTVILLAPNPRISNEDIVTSYVFRFNGVAIAPKRVGPAPAIQDGPEQILENEYEFDGLLDGQYLTVASVGSSSIGSYGDPFFLGTGCCYISDGSIFDGIEETCQEYSTDRGLSYTWSENSCAQTGSWNVGYLVSNSGLFKDKFYITGSQSGSFNDWFSYYGSGVATNFRRNIHPSVLATGTVYDSFRMVPTGNNVNIIISPDVTIKFDKVLSEGSINIQQRENSFSFFTTATTSGNIGFDISNPANFAEGQEIVGLGDDGSLTSLPFSLENNTINSSNIFTNTNHYGRYKIPPPAFSQQDCDTGTTCPNGCIPESNWFCCPDNIHVAMTPEDCPGFSNLSIDYNAQTDYAPDVMPRQGTFAIFGFAPSGFGSVSQFGQHYLNLISAHSDKIYFVDSKGSKIDLGPYVSTSYLHFYPEPTIISASLSSDNNFEICAMDPPIGWLDPNLREVDPVDAVTHVHLVPELLFIPCENPFYTRGGYNIHDVFTFECGCWITLVTRKQVVDFAILVASLYLAITRLFRLVAVLGSSYSAGLKVGLSLEFEKAKYTNEAIFHKGVCDAIEAAHPNIPDAFSPGNLPPGWVRFFPGTDINPSLDDVLQYVEIDEDGFMRRISWEDYLIAHPEATQLHDLDDIYAEWQRYEDNAGNQAAAEGRARAIGFKIAQNNLEMAQLQGEIGSIWAQLAGLLAALAAYRAQLDDFLKGPAISYRKECAPGFDFCAHNELYSVCGGVEEERSYWKKGYSPDGVRLTMPEGWPSCDCCHPCESCHNPPPLTGWGTAASTPCQTCPDGYQVFRESDYCGCEPGYTYYPEAGRAWGCCLDGTFYEPGHGCWDGNPGSEGAAGEFMGPVCCPPVSTLGVFGYSGPYLAARNNGEEACKYVSSDPLQPEIYIDFEFGKKCCDGTCIDACEEC